MLYTLTLNPAWDITYYASSVSLGLNRAYGWSCMAGGKGINVSRAVLGCGGECVTLAVLGGMTGERIASALKAEGIAVTAFAAAGETRTNISLMGDDGTSLEINGPGAALDGACVEQIGYTLADRLREGDILCLCGSLPPVPSVTGSLYTHLCRGAAMAGARVVLDCAGEALADALACDAPPMLIKPNREEMTALVGEPLPEAEDTEAFRCAIRRIVSRKMNLHRTAVLCTLGKSGAVWLDEKETIYVPAVPIEHPKAEKGAGDTYLGTFLQKHYICGAGVREAMEEAGENSEFRIQNAELRMTLRE